MNSRTDRFFLTFIFLCATFLTNAQVENNAYWNKADSLLTSRDFTGSLVELERIVFSTSDIKIRQKAIFQKAMVYKTVGRYEKVHAELARIGVIRNPKDSLFILKAYQQAFAQYMMQNYHAALSTIENCTIMLSENSPGVRSILTLKALCHNQLFEFGQAEKILAQIEQDVREEQAILYARAIKQYDDTPKYKDPETARHLSLLPGLGQVYCGKVFEGGISFLLNASALSFGAWQVYSGYYFTGYVVGVTLLQKFHSGGQHRAELLAIQKNRKNILEFNSKITGALLDAEEK